MEPIDAVTFIFTVFVVCVFFGFFTVDPNISGFGYTGRVHIEGDL